MLTLSDVIQEQIKENIYLGASVSLYRNGQWHQSYFGTIDGSQPVHAGLVYDLASVSKVVGVGTVLAKLIHSNKIDLDDKLVTYYPDFANKQLSLRDLATHASGIDPFIPNRNEMSAEQLKTAINGITVTDNKTFLYTDINAILLGFMLESYFSQSLADIFREEIFFSFGMTQTSFGPVKKAVPTQKDLSDGVVHDPKAKVLGPHTGSAGLFSTIDDLQIFCQHYLSDDFSSLIWTNYSSSNKARSILWNLESDWIDHTGYTGPYIAINRSKQEAAIFLTNRTYAYDDRPLWIKQRQLIIEAIQGERW